MDKIMKEALVQAAVLGLQAVFANLRLAGKTEGEIDKIFAVERVLFDKNNPEMLPGV